MFEQILKKLKDSRVADSQISDTLLETIAKSYGGVITTEEQLAACDFGVVIASVQKDIADNAKTAVEKAVEEANAKITTPPQVDSPKIPELSKNTTSSDIKKVFSAMFKEYMAEYNKKLEVIENTQSEYLKKVSETSRISKFQSIIKDLPEARRKEIEADFGMMTFADDNAFNAFIDRKKTAIDAEVSQMKQGAFDFNIPQNNANTADQASEGSLIEAARKAVADSSNNQNK